MENIMNKPVIGVVMCRNRLKGHETQTLQEKYLNAIINAGGLPIALPHALAEPELLTALLPTLDGIYLPGSPSNVQPHLYGENGDEPDADPGRDLLSMALIAACSSRTTCSSTGKILNCRLSYNTPRLMKFRFRREDCCLN